MMKPIFTLLFAALLLSGCGSGKSPEPDPGMSASAAATDTHPVMGPERRILALGDSLFAGYGLDRGQSYPARLEASLRARGINARIANAGVSGDTTQAGLQRLKFTLDSQSAPPELILISLGGNDLLRGIPPSQTRANLEAILTELDRRKIRAVLMGMLAPPNLGPGFRAEFDAIYPALAKAHQAALVPFFLQPVFGKANLIQADHIHPTREGIEDIVGATVDVVTKALPPA